MLSIFGWKGRNGYEGTDLAGQWSVRVEEVPDPVIQEPTDATVKIRS
jgi:hypothetical protein